MSSFDSVVYTWREMLKAEEDSYEMLMRVAKYAPGVVADPLDGLGLSDLSIPAH